MFSSKGSMLVVKINISDERGDRLKGIAINIEQVSKRLSIWVCNCKDYSWQFALSNKCSFGKDYFYQLFLIFGLFLLLFIGLIALFDIIHGSHCIISVNFIYSVFSKKFSVSIKISRSQYTYGVEYESYGP